MFETLSLFADHAQNLIREHEDLRILQKIMSEREAKPISEEACCQNQSVKVTAQSLGPPILTKNLLLVD